MYLYRTWENAIFSRFGSAKLLNRQAVGNPPFLKRAGLGVLLAWLALAGTQAVNANAQAQVSAPSPVSTAVPTPAPTTTTTTSAATTATTATTAIPYADDSSTVRVGLPGAKLAGSAKLTVWGFDVYRASLWVAPSFRQTRYADHPFALELAYLRKFDANAITQRTLDEMQRQGKLPPEKARAWREAMLSIFPDVKPGDRITAIHQPGAPTRFLFNGKPKGEIVDDDFDRLFFGIWLSDATSEPSLRQALLAQTAR